MNSEQKTARTAIALVTAIVGGVTVLGTVTGAALAGTRLFANTDSVQRVDMTGLTGIELDVSARDVRVEFGDVDQAELAITNGGGQTWTFERDDDELVVRSPSFSFNWFGDWSAADETVVLTLPARLRGAALDADLNLNAGSLHVDGDFGDLGINIRAGQVEAAGSARTLEAEMSAGRADIRLSGVNEADLAISAGALDVVLTGNAPTETTIEARAGSVDLTVPDEQYRIVREETAGSLDVQVDQSTRSRYEIDIEVSAGSVTITPGG